MTARHRMTRAGAVLAALAALIGCSSSAGSAEPGPAPSPNPATSSSPAVEVGVPASVTSATLQDSVVPQADGRVLWTTTWRACFAPGAAGAPAVAGWEAEVSGLEGASPELQDLPDGCLELDVARGINRPDAGMPGRDVQLVDAAALAYRVRAVHTDGTVTPWTPPVRAGTVR
jgi:hypothetical protein